MCQTHGLQIVTACIFNILGPGQPDTLVPMTFINQFIDIRSGLVDQLKVGQTASRRDFVDVRDVVAAFDALLQHGQAGQTYNIASGHDISIQEILDELLKITGLDVSIEVASERVRPVDVPCVRASVSKIATDTNWQPRIPLYKSLEDMWLNCISEPER